MFKRYGKFNGFDFSKQCERFHIPTLLKYCKNKEDSRRVSSFGQNKNQNYNKFHTRMIPGNHVYVIVWDYKRGRHCVEKATIVSVFYFDYSNNHALWNVWLDHYHHNTGLLEDDEYFLTKSRAQWFLDHKMTIYHTKKDENEWWRKLILSEKNN